MKDLFGDEAPDEDIVAAYLAQMDKETLQERRDHLDYIFQIAPEHGFVMPSESFYVMTEARDAYVNGLYVATLFLAQAFIEHRLQIYVSGIGKPEIGNKGLHHILKWLMENKPKHSYFWDRIDILRQFRNPFVHLKPMGHTQSLSQTLMRQKRDPRELLNEKAREALALMYEVALLE